jgi:hypothetical protein
MAKTLKKKTYRKKAKKQIKRKTYRKRGGNKRSREEEETPKEQPIKKSRSDIMRELRTKISHYRDKLIDDPVLLRKYIHDTVGYLEEELKIHKDDDAQYFDAQRGNPSPEEMNDLIILKLLEKVLDTYRPPEDQQKDEFDIDPETGEMLGPSLTEQNTTKRNELKERLEKYGVHL